MIHCILIFNSALYDAELAKKERERGVPNSQLHDTLPIFDDERPLSHDNDYGFLPPNAVEWVSILFYFIFLWWCYMIRVFIQIIDKCYEKEDVTEKA